MITISTIIIIMISFNTFNAITNTNIYVITNIITTYFITYINITTYTATTTLKTLTAYTKSDKYFIPIVTSTMNTTINIKTISTFGKLTSIY